MSKQKKIREALAGIGAAIFALALVAGYLWLGDRNDPKPDSIWAIKPHSAATIWHRSVHDFPSCWVEKDGKMSCPTSPPSSR